MNVGDKIQLINTGNHYIPDGTPATILELHPWGAVVKTAVTVTSTYRATWKEMQSIKVSGDICDTCGSHRMQRVGTCLCCQDCGSTTGCS